MITKHDIQYITDKKGKKMAVLLKFQDYMQLLEDLEDLTTIANRKKEPTIPNKEFIKQLKTDGLI